MSPISFGAFKIGRNQGTKYPHGYVLPDQEAVDSLLNAVLDMGINLIDTAPAYGVSEQRLGLAIANRRNECLLATKIGERFESGQSNYDFSKAALTTSLDQSLEQLQTDHVDLLHIHSNGDDVNILQHTDAVETIQLLKAQGKTRFIGFSGKTTEGALMSLDWADTLMIEYNPEHTEHAPIIAQAANRGLGVLIKKPLGSGHLDPQSAIQQGLSIPGASTLVVGSLNADHLQQNLHWAHALD